MNRVGFTLIELLMVLLTLGIMLAVAYTQFGGEVSRHRALDASARLVALGLANRRYAVDNQGRFVHRSRTFGTLFNCDGAECLPCEEPVCPSCNLLACDYIPREVVTDAHFFLNAVSPAAEGSACGLPQPQTGSKIVACAARGSIVKSAGVDGKDNFDIEYAGWAYTYHEDGSVVPHNGAPPAGPTSVVHGTDPKDYEQ